MAGALSFIRHLGEIACENSAVLLACVQTPTIPAVTMPPVAPQDSGSAPRVKLLALHRQRLWQILIVAIAAFALIALMNLARGRLLFVVLHGSIIGLLLLAAWWNRRGQPDRVVQFMVVVLMFGLSAIMAADQGLFDESVLAYPTLLILAGMYGSWRLLALLTGLMLTALITLYALGQLGWLHNAALPIGPPRLIGLCVILLVTGFFVYLLASDLSNTMQQLETEKRALQVSHERIEVLAQRDSLTGLPNRSLAKDRLDRMLSRAGRENRMVAVMFLDVDDFKTINDSLGHPAGDDLLRQIGTRLQACVRGSDTVARIAGDEFLILIGDLESERDLSGIVAQIMQSTERTFSLDGMDVAVTLSLGVTVAPRDGNEIDVLLKNADLAMYRAKDSGRNTYRFFDSSMTESVVEQLLIASGLRTALARGEMQVHYQPEFDLRSGRVVGAEALLRWWHPELGLVSPARFIPIAERSGLINDLGQWVLQQACASAQGWRRQGLGDLTVAVNVSALQFHREHIERTVAQTLSACEVPPGTLVLELTESMLMAEARHLDDALQALAALGVKIAIDDFGTGYSNLSYLSRFAVHRLKIDQSFVQKMADSPQDQQLVRAIIEMAHCLDMAVVAEGIEDHDTLERLSAFGCEFAQGFHWSPALPAHEFVAFVRERNQVAA